MSMRIVITFFWLLLTVSQALAGDAPAGQALPLTASKAMILPWAYEHLVSPRPDEHAPWRLTLKRLSQSFRDRAGCLAGWQKPVPTFYFDGQTKRHALIVSGVHGSEAGGVEVVELLLARLRQPDAPKPYFSVIVVPVLFAENLASGNRATPDHADPNRQLPPVGRDHRYDSREGCYLDAEKRCMESANVYLLNLIAHYKPERIASVHGHSNIDLSPDGLLKMMTRGGPSITTDPRPGHEAEDDSLALHMARYADSLGVRVPANFLGTGRQTTRYPNGTALRMSAGITLGQWASRPTPTRPAVNVITVETFGYANSGQGRDLWRWKELDGFAQTLQEVFLGRPDGPK